MTRDECLGAISAAFDDVQVWAVVGFWNVNIETSPKRELSLTQLFVDQNIDKDGLLPEEFTEAIKSINENDWLKAKDGSLFKIYGYPSDFTSFAKNGFPRNV